MEKVLIVDDDPVILYSYSRILKKAGYTVYTSDNGFDALDIITSEKPDLVLIDVVMPVMTGFDLLSSIKSNPAIKNSKVFLISGHIHSESHKKKGLQLGAEKILLKPLKEMDLLNAVNEYKINKL